MSTASDIVIVGGGVISLAIALELQLQGASVTLLCRDVAEAATHAAGGMLAPQAEGIPPSPMLDLCLWSRELYADWTQKVEQLSGLKTGYWTCGILAPRYESPAIDGSKAHSSAASTEAHWLDRAAIHAHQPGLSDAVGGGWWYPQDAQVDNRLLVKALWVAARELGITVKPGVTVTAIAQHQGEVTHLKTTAGNWQAAHYILATGAWSQALLPIPVFPRKGQMLSVRVPTPPADPADLPLQTILFGSEIYIIPRQDGRIVLGATSEDVAFTLHNTPVGIHTLLSAAIRLYPELATFSLEEFWWGFRPATPDELPILGSSPCHNLTLATGHYRNGILLAPATAALIAAWVLHQKSDSLLSAFHWSRFMV